MTNLASTLIPEVQESTHQVPCGPHSIFDPEQVVPEYCRAVYLVMNYHSNYGSGITHALSYQRLAELTGVKHRSQPIRAVRWLIENGWTEKHGIRKADGANFYKLTHHKCPPEDVPWDNNNRPLKCAVPQKDGSAPELVKQGKLDWRAMVQWYVNKINSDWITGVVEMTVRKSYQLLKFGMQTICDNTKKLIECGLLNRLSPQNHASVFQLYPKPYPERKERKIPAWHKKPLALIKDWYYSYNKRWRFHRKTLRIQMKNVDGRWRDSGMSELLNINTKIHADFREYMDIVSKIPNSFSNLNCPARS